MEIVTGLLIVHGPVYLVRLVPAGTPVFPDPGQEPLGGVVGGTLVVGTLVDGVVVVGFGVVVVGFGVVVVGVVVVGFGVVVAADGADVVNTTST